MQLTLLQRSFIFAAQAHAGQNREGEHPLPYFTHPAEVLNNLRFIGEVTDEEMLAAASLHDVVEETPITLDQIGEEFGERVESLVKELTRKEPEREQVAGLSKEQIWELRSGMLLGEISLMSKDAQAIKLADRLANLKDAKRNKREKKLRRYVGQTEKILAIVPETANVNLWRAIEREIGH